MLDTAHVANGAEPDTVDPPTPTDPATTPWPGEAAVTVTGLVAVWMVASAVAT